jgi:peptidoglycan/xylan/chitin deacetylase (PgdA/CDA1 family)
MVVAWPLIASSITFAAALSAWGACHPAAQLFGRTVRRTGSRQELALTFEDGPNPATTPWLLDLLDSHSVKATFFVIGRHARACKSLLREIAARGHALGNHTEGHENLLWLSRRRIVDRLNRCQQVIAEASGQPADCLRPPYGRRGPHLQVAAERAGCRRVVMWSFAAEDARGNSHLEIVHRLRKVRGGDVVLFRDGEPERLHSDRRQIVAALDYWLPRWKDKGLRFVTL